MLTILLTQKSEAAFDLKQFYITTPIYYTNAKPHIGHCYTTLICDTLARFYKLSDKPVKFLTGTDEHGIKIQKTALEAGKEPQEFVDEVSQKFRYLIEKFKYINDDFIRTTEERHKKAVVHLWNELVKRDQIYLGTYKGWYAPKDEQFYDEADLVNGKAPTGVEVEWVEEDNYFFRLSQWKDKIIEHINNNSTFIQPETRKNEILSFLQKPLKDLSVSRKSVKWGIPVPGNDDHTIYVWIDALTNYLTAAGYPGDISKTWPADIHFVGKDILVFHAVYWSAILLALDIPLPKKIFAHGFWKNKDVQIRKSFGNAIDPIELSEKYGLDAVKYFLLRETTFGQDGNISDEQVIKRNNEDLANDFGNLSQRILSMVFKVCDGKIPERTTITEDDKKLLDTVYIELLPKVSKHIDDLQFSRCLEEIWKVVTHANQWFDAQAPWKLKNIDVARYNSILHTAVEVLIGLAVIVQPFLPDTSEKLLAQCGLNSEIKFSDLPQANRNITGLNIPKPEPLFPKYEVKS